MSQIAESRRGRAEVCVVGGAGHVGAPLAIVLASRGIRTIIHDVNAEALKLLAQGRLPFIEDGGEALLQSALKQNMLEFSPDPSCVAGVPVIIVTIGTPIDEFHNPVFRVLTDCIDRLLPHLTVNQTIILRSTVAPGVTEFLDRYLLSKGKACPLAFCPERVVQGKGVEEIQSLPQLVSGTSAAAVSTAKALFKRIAPKVIEMSTREAELAKLVCNAYRYIEFAAANQLYMLVESAGVNYNELLSKVKDGYPRTKSMPRPGFAAGPCLMKDTMQLSALGKRNFLLGQLAVTINEGLPDFVVERLASRRDLRGASVGILGMAFKAESDDVRDSLSYKLRKILTFHGASVICSDEYVKDPAFVDKETLAARCEVVIVAVPHAAYRSLTFPPTTEIVDMWSSLRAVRGA